MIRDNWVHNENWFQVMNVTSLCTFCEDVHLWADSSICNLGQLSLHVEGEASEVFHIDTASSLQVFVNILDERLPYDEILCFWLQWLHAWGGSLS